MKVPMIMPRLYFGTMTFGWQQTSSYVDEAIAKEMTKKFIDFSPNHYYIDTARIYAGGKTEQIIGDILQEVISYCDASSSAPNQHQITIGTKAHPSQPNGLSKEGIIDQFNKSIQAMKIDNVGEYYLHQPDTENSMLESLQCIHELITQGKVKSLGLSNYHAIEVKRVFDLCDTYGLTKPTVYQGLYNPLNRVVEKELLPLLSANGCAFVAYNPLAAGLLTGKHKRSSMEDVKEGRFKNNPNYLPRFYTDDNFAALEIIQSACEDDGISMLEATFKWLFRHSALNENDGVLLGASSITQLDENLGLCRLALATDDEYKPLSDKVLKAFDDAWKITEKSAFPYWRSYSKDMPNRESLDHGASYDAIKK